MPCCLGLQTDYWGRKALGTVLRSLWVPCEQVRPLPTPPPQGELTVFIPALGARLV